MSFSRAPFPAQTIAVLSGREAIGDGLIKLPFLRALRAVWPQASVHWITTQGETVYDTSLRAITAPLITTVHTMPSWLCAKAERGPAPHFDLVIDTRGRWRSVLQARKRLPCRLFIAPALRYLLSDRRPPLLAPTPPLLIDRLLQAVALAAGFIPEVTGRLPIPRAFSEAAQRQLQTEKSRILIGLAPGAGNAIKVWPLERFEELARLQAARGRVPVFLLGPQEAEKHKSLAHAVPQALFPLQASDEAWGGLAQGLERTLAIGQHLHLAITNDSGTSHMLAASGCPLLRLFGPTQAGKFSPQEGPLKEGGYNAILRAKDFGNGEAMEQIPLSAVCQKVEDVLAVLDQKESASS